METEHWALLISVVALLTSIITFILQSLSHRRAAIDSKRNQLLQTLNEIKTITFASRYELINLLDRHSAEMEPQKIKILEDLFPEIDSHLGGAEDLHPMWSSFDDGATLREIEEGFVDIDAILADAQTTAKIIENERRSFGGA